MYGVFPLFPAMKGLFMSSVSETVSTSQGELEKLVGDLRGLLASRDLDGIPEIKQLRQRLDDGIQTVRQRRVDVAHLGKAFQELLGRTVVDTARAVALHVAVPAHR